MSIDIAEKNKALTELNSSLQTKEQRYKEEINDKMLVIYELERQVSDLQSRYDKEKALFEGQVKFLTEQKDQVSKIMAENQAKFEESLK